VWWNQHSTSGRGTRNIIARSIQKHFGETEKIQDGNKYHVKTITQIESRSHSDSHCLNCEVNFVGAPNLPFFGLTEILMQRDMSRKTFDGAN
jgi:hypothetical protein